MARLTYLDLVRGICAIVVLIVHYRWFYSMDLNGFGEAMKHPLPLQDFLMPLYLHGGWAVQAFWVLSGVIFFIRYFEQGKYIDGRKFAVWRFARLYPLHLATLVLVALIQTISVWQFGTAKVYGENTLQAFGLHLFFVAHWLDPNEHSFNAPIWSVSIEIIAYALFYLTLRLAGAQITAFAVMFAMLTVAAKITGSPILLCGSLFFLGCLTAYIFQRLPSRILVPFAILGLCTGAVLLNLTAGHKMVFFYLGLPSIMLLTLTMDRIAKPLPHSVRWLGDITYSTYLCHMPVLMLAKFWIDQQPNAFVILASPITLFFWLGSVIGLSYLVYRYFELPSQMVIQNHYRKLRGIALVGRSIKLDAQN